MNNVANTAEIVLDVFGGQNNELAPTDLPQGLSPECPDMAFLPGQAFTRPSLTRLFTAPTSAQIIYHHTYQKPDGTVVQMLFDANGNIYANGVRIGGTKAGNRFYCTNAFGRVYIAVSDGLHGQDVPLQYDGTNLDRVSQNGPAAPPTIANISLSPVSIMSLQRANGQVSVTTSDAHGVQPGYQIGVAGVADYSLSITSAVINNQVLPGVATVTTGAAHKLIPGQTVTLLNIPQVAAGGSVNKWQAGDGGTSLLLGTTSPHGLRVNDTVTESTGSGYQRTHTVDTVQDAQTIVVLTTDASGSGTTGTLTTPWPADSGQTYTVLETPTTTTFTIQQDGPSESWSGGTVNFAWSGNFFVASTPTSTSLTYAQIGPDASATGGTLTPIGQVAPGPHSCVVMFVTRQGAILKPSPPVLFNASGSQYLQVSNIPLGPSNVVARYLAFTGANGGKYFYLPIQPAINSQLVGTSTAIPDNTTTSVVMDFSDQSLFSGKPIDQPGSDYFRCQVLDSALGFAIYRGRLCAWGNRNTVLNLLNLGFEGGTITANQPLGWTVNGTGTLAVSGDYGLAWNNASGSTITQSAYQDAYGAPIFQAQTQYTIRAWVNGTATVDLYSPSQGVLATTTLTATGQFVEGVWSAQTPVAIPPDALFRVSGGWIDEITPYYTVNPYKLGLLCSYVNAPEEFDAVSGILGPDDPHPVRATYRKRDIFNLLTAGPKGSRYEVEDSPSGEPATWNVRRTSSQCGAISVWGTAQFEDYEVWASDTGLRIDVGEVDKISQEVDAFWSRINPQYSYLACIANDPYTRRVYVSAPTGTSTVPNELGVLDYRELNTAGLLAGSGTLRVSGSGRVITTDLTRKWSQWSATVNHCGMMQLADGEGVMVFAGGNGDNITANAQGAVYELAEGIISGIDDDYGPFWHNCGYTTAFLVDSQTAQAERLSIHRLLHVYITANITGVGQVYLQPLLNQTSITSASTRALNVSINLSRDLEWPVNLTSDRIAYRVSCQPSGPAPYSATATAGFRVSRMSIATRTDPWAPIRGRNG